MDLERFEGAMEGLRTRTPFRPFTLVMQSGRSYEVDHPHNLHSSEGSWVYFLTGGIPIFFDHESVSKIVRDLKSSVDGQQAIAKA